MIKKFLVHCLLFGFIFSTLPVYSQCPDPMNPDCEGDPDDPVPLDGGVSLLIGAGVVYGLRELSKRRED